MTRASASAVLAAIASITIYAPVCSAQKQQGSSGYNAQEIIAAERAIWEMFKNNDFERLAKAITGNAFIDGTTMGMGAQPTTAKDFAGVVTKSYSFDSVSTREVSPGIVALTARATRDQSYTDPQGSVFRAPSPIHMMTIWQRRDGKWTPLAHAETPAVMPKPEAKTKQ